MLSVYYFQILGAFISGTCLLVSIVQNPIHSILLLIRVFFIGTLLLFFLQREYYARLFLIVYVGAIVVLFLFIIRILELKILNVANRFKDLFIFRYIILVFFCIEVFFLISQAFFDLNSFRSVEFFKNPTLFIEGNQYMDWSKLIQPTDQLRSLGGLLYNEYKITVILASMLLFLSIVGALAITRFFPEKTFKRHTYFNIKLQDPNIQTRRHPYFM
jgi:NADH:ubiquinone oxidoreductase subunit 6 (subunit J)